MPAACVGVVGVVDGLGGLSSCTIPAPLPLLSSSSLSFLLGTEARP